MFALPLTVWIAQAWFAWRARQRTLARNWPLVVLCGLAATLYSSTLSRDAPLYQEAFSAFSGSGLDNVLIELAVIEPAFLIVAKVANALGIGAVLLFALYAFASSALKIWLILKVSRDPRLSLLVFISYFFLLHDSTQIRASMAIALIYWGAWDLCEGRTTAFWVKLIVAAALFHMSSLAFGMAYFFRFRWARPVLLVTLSASVLIYFSGFSAMSLLIWAQGAGDLAGTIIGGKLDSYSATLDDYPIVGPWVPLALLSYLLAALLWTLRSAMNRFESFCFNSLLFSFIPFVLLADFPVAQFRFSELFSYGLVFLVPMLFARRPAGRPSEQVMVRTAFLVCCLGIFCYFAYYKAMV